MKKIYIIGICGKTTAAIALMFKEMGYKVSGSDSNYYPPVSTFLDEHNIAFSVGYKESSIAEFNPDIVMVGGSATFVLADNPETSWAKENSKEILTYPEILQKYLVKENSIVVTGTYGKGTISAMLTWIFETAGLNPSFMIGGIPLNFGKGIRNTNSNISVIEGDEYIAGTINGELKSKFFYYNPTHLIISSMQWDHLDIFKTEQEYINNFQKLVETLPDTGTLLTNNEGENVNKLEVENKVKHIKYGNYYKEIKYLDGQINYKVILDNEELSIISNFFGEHNVKNSIAAIIMAKQFGVSNEDIEKAFKTYNHLKSHQELLDQVNGIRIYADLAHSAVKAKATIKAFSQVFDKSKINIVFDVYAPSMKNKETLSWFDNVFGDIKAVYIPKVNAVKTSNGFITGKDIVNAIKKTYEKVEYIPDDIKLADMIASDVKSGDIVIYMSSGDVSKKVELLKHKLNEKI